MKKNLLLAAVILGLAFLLIGCQPVSNPRTYPNPAGAPGNTQPVTQSTPTAATAGQTVNNPPSTLQPDGTSTSSVDTTQIDQELNDLQNSLQATDVPTPAPDSADTLDQDLNNLQQTLQAQPTP